MHIALDALTWQQYLFRCPKAWQFCLLMRSAGTCCQESMKSGMQYRDVKLRSSSSEIQQRGMSWVIKWQNLNVQKKKKSVLYNSCFTVWKCPVQKEWTNLVITVWRITRSSPGGYSLIPAEILQYPFVSVLLCTVSVGPVCWYVGPSTSSARWGTGCRCTICQLSRQVSFTNFMDFMDDGNDTEHHIPKAFQRDYCHMLREQVQNTSGQKKPITQGKKNHSLKIYFAWNTILGSTLALIVLLHASGKEQQNWRALWEA